MINGPQEAGVLSGIARRKNAERRTASVIALYVAGLSFAEIGEKLGVSPRTVSNDLVNHYDQMQSINGLLEDSPIDADDLHIRLSQMFDADIADIIDPDTNCYKPIHQWPKIWRQMLTGSELKEIFEHSKDGGGASWDKIGEVVKIRFVDQMKVLELAMKHKAVDAMVQQKAGDTNILVVTAETARKVTGARARLAKVIDVTPQPVVNDSTTTGQ